MIDRSFHADNEEKVVFLGGVMGGGGVMGIVKFVCLPCSVPMGFNVL